MQWWLPNNERYPPIIRSIRKFVEERTSPAVDVTTEDLKDMKTIFASCKLFPGYFRPTLGVGVGMVTWWICSWEAWGRGDRIVVFNWVTFL